MADDALLALVRKIAGEAKPGEQVEAYAARSKGTEVKVFGGEVESLASENVEGVGVRVVVDGRQGFAWAGTLEPDVVAETLAEARDNAGFGSPDEYLGLPDPDDAGDPGNDRASLDLWREALLATPADDKVALALELERAVMAADSRIRGVRTVSYGDGASEMALANSLGVEATARRTVCSLSALTLAGEGVGTRTGYGFSVGREPSELDLEEAAQMAVERAVRLLGATQPKTRRLPVVFDPLVVSSIIGVISGSLNGEAVLKGRSMFATRLGEMVAGPTISIVDDPTNPEAFGAAGYDSEGVPTRPVRMIENGRLARFLHNVHSGRRSGTGTTGSAVRAGYTTTPGVGSRALHFEPGSASPEELLRKAEGGLFVQSITGLGSGASTVTGDFSVGADGLIIRDGALAEPVREVTVASTFQRILLDLEIGNDLQWLAGGAAGVTILVPEMAMSGA
ncbi:MAG TPA: TldD/PmbA family protein [Acidimicrobiia bacterium]|nr:TldD/PmbA family protein [Acidimicrobiia bacterium]